MAISSPLTQFAILSLLIAVYDGRGAGTGWILIGLYGTGPLDMLSWPF